MQDIVLIPANIYEELFNQIIFFCLFAILLRSFTAQPNALQLLGYAMLIFSIFFIGYRPISNTFDDMKVYNRKYLFYQSGGTQEPSSDILFYMFSKFLSYFMSVENYFLTIAVIYIIPFYSFSKKHLKENWFFLFFALVGSFSFFGYGVNGLRNGIATSLFILAFSFYDKKLIMWSILFLSFGFHNSMIIPIAAYACTFFINQPKFYLMIWAACIPISLLGGGVFETFFSTIGFEDRTQGYLTGDEEMAKQFSRTGFRWDFLLYSLLPILAGYFYIVNMKIKDKLYYSIFGTYAAANAFWILVIRANFSNRFAYLSWFLMAIVIFYPLYKYKMFKNQYVIASILLIVYFSFTYFMNVIL